MLNIVIPMAGRGSRFADAGYELPKPLIDAGGVPMIELVVGNITPSAPHRFIFICREEHLRRYALKSLLERVAPGCVIVSTKEVTEGAACTVLLASRYIDTPEPLMIANSDQYIDVDIDGYLGALGCSDGLIMTMPGSGPKWSYVRLGADGYVTEVREKKVISGRATVGIYNFARGSDFVRRAGEMVRAGERENGEFYVAPVYNRLVASGARVVCYDVGSAMHGLGTPGDLREFLRWRVQKGRGNL